VARCTLRYYLISSHLISSHLISSHLISSHLISSHLISSRILIVPTYILHKKTIDKNTNCPSVQHFAFMSTKCRAHRSGKSMRRKRVVECANDHVIHLFIIIGRGSTRDSSQVRGMQKWREHAARSCFEFFHLARPLSRCAFNFHLYVCMYFYMYVCLHVCAYIFKYINIYVYICIYIYIYI